MNGVRVDRGGRWGLEPKYVRSGGLRDTSGQSGNGSDKVGFRLNGVWRGDSYSAPVTLRGRSGFRWGENNKRDVSLSLGFRCEWCSAEYKGK